MPPRANSKTGSLPRLRYLAEHVAQDFPVALRRLRHAPLFGATVVVTLAIGIGAATALFSVVRGVLLRPLPYPDEQRVVSIWEDNVQKGIQWSLLSAADIQDLRARTRSIDVAPFSYNMAVIAGDPAPRQAMIGMVPPEMFHILGVRPLLGRPFVPGEEQAAILSYRLWTSRFNRDPAVIGRPIVVDGSTVTVVGVMPRSFEFPRHAQVPRDIDLLTPLGNIMAQANAPGRRGMRPLSLIGRLRPGATVEMAREEIATASRELAELYPETNRGWVARVAPMRAQMSGSVRPALTALTIAVAVLLVIVCVNVGHLLALNTMGRSQGLAVRLSLGASAGDLVRLVLLETSVLAFFAGVLGMGVAAALRTAVIATAPATLPRSAAITIDSRVFLFGFLTSMGVGFACAIVPILRLRRLQLRDVLAASSRTLSGSSQPFAMVTSEVALASILALTGASLLLGIARLQRIAPGFEPRKAMMATVTLNRDTYSSPESRSHFVEEFIGRLRTIPGVVGAASASLAPLSGGLSTVPYFTGPRANAEPTSQAAMRIVSDDYFAVIGQVQLVGRVFSRLDDAQTPAVAIVNEAFVHRVLGLRDVNTAIGRVVRSSMLTPNMSYEIIGVVADVKETGLESPPLPAVYYSIRQRPFPQNTFVIRWSSHRPSIGELGATLAGVDRNLALDDVMTLEERVGRSYGLQRFNLGIIAVLGSIALILLAAGVYAVLAQLVTAQRRSIAIRLALGATPAVIGRNVVLQLARPVLAGLLVGGFASLALSRALQQLAPGLTDYRASALCVAAASVITATGIAALLPVIRASRVSPGLALRSEG